MDPELSLVKLFAEVGMTGLVAWIVWQMFRKTIPDMLETFKEQLTLERQQCRHCVEAIEQLSLLLIRLYERIGGDVDDDLNAFLEQRRRCSETASMRQERTEQGSTK